MSVAASTAASSFLSTPSARRATLLYESVVNLDIRISIHALREEGDRSVFEIGNSGKEISIHALREEGDFASNTFYTSCFPFLSTPSARRATSIYTNLGEFLDISIHALREEGDETWQMLSRRLWNFYPRPPRGGRLTDGASQIVVVVFLSTPSARRATRPQRSQTTRRAISIHALREEGDSHRQPLMAPSSYFYPRPPRGGRLFSRPLQHGFQQFLSTPSARRATAGSSPVRPRQNYFYPRPPRGGRPTRSAPKSRSRTISIHALREEGDLASTPRAAADSYFYPRPPRGGRPSAGTNGASF